MSMNCEQIKRQFPDWKTMKPGEWSKHPIILTYGCHSYEYIEIGLYREPMNGDEYEGTYTLHGFNGDEVVFCETVQ